MKKTITLNTPINFTEAYKNQYLIYNRKSTDEPENQKNSIQYQKLENEHFAHRNNLSIASIAIEGFCTNGIISERHSAFKEGNDITIGSNGMVQYKIERPKFHRLLDLLNRGYFKGVIILCWDRISRNKADETIIRKLMKQGVDFRFVLASYDNTSSGALHMDIDGMFAAHHSRVTSEKVKLAIRNQREKGVCTFQAPIGYLNTGSMLNKPFDPIRAPIIKRIFELYATGEYSFASILNYAITQGLTMPAKRKRRKGHELLSDDELDNLEERPRIESLPHVSAISRILNNPFYIGLIPDNYGGVMKSISHEPLISPELFYKVQKVIGGKTTTIHYSNLIKYPYRGLIRCFECNRVYTPYEQKGNIYFGSRCKKNCNNSNRCINYENVQRLLNNAIESFRLTEYELEQLSAITSTDIALFNAQRLNKLDENERAKKKIRENLSYLQNATIDLLQAGVFTTESLVHEKRKLETQLASLQQSEETSDKAMSNTIQEVLKLSELLKSLILQDVSANNDEKEQIVRLLFSELWVKEDALLYKLHSEFKPFESRVVLNCAQLSWISELSKSFTQIKNSNNKIQACMNSPNKLRNAA